jgi:predicted CopG family antitoxin
LKENIYLLTTFTILFMLATKRIPVSETVWIELSDLKAAGQTYSELLEEMIEDRKKARFFRDMERIEREDEFVEFP